MSDLNKYKSEFIKTSHIRVLSPAKNDFSPDGLLVRSLREPNRQDILQIMNKIAKAGILDKHERTYLIDYINYATGTQRNFNSFRTEQDRLSNNSAVSNEQSLVSLVYSKLGIDSFTQPTLLQAMVEERLNCLLAYEQSALKEISRQDSGNFAPSLRNFHNFKFKLSEFDCLKQGHGIQENDCLKSEAIGFLQNKIQNLKLENAIQSWQIKLFLESVAPGKLQTLHKEQRTLSTNICIAQNWLTNEVITKPFPSSPSSQRRESFFKDSTAFAKNDNSVNVSDFSSLLNRIGKCSDEKISQLIEAVKINRKIEISHKSTLSKVTSLKTTEQILQRKDSPVPNPKLYMSRPKTVVPSNKPGPAKTGGDDASLKILLQQLKTELQAVEGTIITPIKDKKREIQEEAQKRFNDITNQNEEVIFGPIIDVYKKNLSLKMLIESVISCNDKQAKFHLLEEFSNKGNKAISQLNSKLMKGPLLASVCEMFGIPIGLGSLEDMQKKYTLLSFRSELLDKFEASFKLKTTTAENKEKTLEFIEYLNKQNSYVLEIRKVVPMLFSDAKSSENLLNITELNKIQEALEIKSIIDQEKSQQFESDTQPKGANYLMDIFAKKSIIKPIIKETTSLNFDLCSYGELASKWKDFSDELGLFSKAKKLIEKDQEDNSSLNWFEAFKRILSDKERFKSQINILENQLSELNSKLNQSFQNINDLKKVLENMKLSKEEQQRKNESLSSDYKELESNFVVLEKFFINYNDLIENSKLIMLNKNKTREEICESLNELKKLESCVLDLQSVLPDILDYSAPNLLNLSKISEIKEGEKIRACLVEDINLNLSPVEIEITTFNYISDIIAKKKILEPLIKKGMSLKIENSNRQILRAKSQELINELDCLDQLKKIIELEEPDFSPSSNWLENIEQILKTLKGKNCELLVQLSNTEGENVFLTTKFLGYQDEIYNLKKSLEEKIKEGAGLNPREETPAAKDFGIKQMIEGNFLALPILDHNQPSLASQSTQLNERSKNLKKQVSKLEAKIKRMKIVFDLLGVNPSDKDLVEKVKLRIFEMGLNPECLSQPSSMNLDKFKSHRLSVSEYMSAEENNLSSLSSPLYDNLGDLTDSNFKKASFRHQFGNSPHQPSQHEKGSTSHQNMRKTQILEPVLEKSPFAQFDLFSTFSVPKS